MKIVSGQFQRIHEAYGMRRKAVPEAPGPEKTAGSSDSVELSESAQEVRRLKAYMDQTPEARSQRVEEIQQALAAGTYQTDSRQIAQRMLESGALDEEF